MERVEFKLRSGIAIAANIFFMVWLFMFFSFFVGAGAFLDFLPKLFENAPLFGFIWTKGFFGGILYFLYRFGVSSFLYDHWAACYGVRPDRNLFPLSFQGLHYMGRIVVRL
jgi:hypothetical protein